MGGLRTTVWRRIAGALALAGVLLYTSLIPGHIVSQLVTALVDAELGTAIICHSGEAPQQPNKSNADQGCPFCHGHASFQLAAFTAGATFVVPAQSAWVSHRVESDSLLTRAVPTPQSRGPPHLSV